MNNLFHSLQCEMMAMSTVLLVIDEKGINDLVT